MFWLQLIELGQDLQSGVSIWTSRCARYPAFRTRLFAGWHCGLGRRLNWWHCINCNLFNFYLMRNIILIAFLREKLQHFRSDLKICGNLDEMDTLWSYIPRTLITQQTNFFKIIHPAYRRILNAGYILHILISNILIKLPLNKIHDSNVRRTFQQVVPRK